MKVNHLSKELKRTKDLFVIIVERYGIHQKSIGVMVNQNSVENAIVITSQDTEQVNVQRKPSLKENVSIATIKGTNL